jgi:hypothetical protein
VLLAKCHEDGLMIASTMWMAIPGMEQLVSRICEVDVREVVSAHKYVAMWRWCSDVILGLAFAWGYRMIWIRFPGQVHGVWNDLGKFWTTLILFRLWLHLIFRRPYGVNPFQFARRGWAAFWGTI